MKRDIHRSDIQNEGKEYEVISEGNHMIFSVDPLPQKKMPNISI